VTAEETFVGVVRVEVDALLKSHVVTLVPAPILGTQWPTVEDEPGRQARLCGHFFEYELLKALADASLDGVRAVREWESAAPLKRCEVFQCRTFEPSRRRGEVEMGDMCLVAVGQCGNQIASQLAPLAIAE
jgi:hypothetical protein